MTDFEETSKKIRDLVDEVFKQGIGVGYDHGLEVGTQNGYKRGYENGQKSEQTGHWSRKTKVDAYDIAGVKTWGIKCQCDRCDFTTIVVEDFGYYNYCPNCGARMVEQERSDKE